MSIQIARRLRSMLERLGEALPEERRPALEREMMLLRDSVDRSFPDEDDRVRAGMADDQSVADDESVADAQQ